MLLKINTLYKCTAEFVWFRELPVITDKIAPISDELKNQIVLILKRHQHLVFDDKCSIYYVLYKNRIGFIYVYEEDGPVYWEEVK